MNITQEQVSPVQARLNVAVDEADYKDKVKAKLKEIGRTHTMPGFRAGHVPYDTLFRRMGKAVTSDVINDVVYEAVVNFIKENALDVLGQPMAADVKEVKTEGPQLFSFDVALFPALKVAPDKSMTVPYYEVEVSEKMIDEQDLAMRKRAGKQKPGEQMEKDAVVKGAIMQLNDDGTVNQNEGAIQMTNGIVFPLYFKDGEQTAKFDGCKPGDRIVFNPFKASGGDAGEIASMLGIDKSIAPDIKGDFEMNVSEIIVNEPAELGQEYYDTVFGKDKIHDEKEYREAVKNLIAQDLRNESNRFFRMVFDQQFFKDNAGVELPDSLLTRMFFSEAENPEETYQKQRKNVRNEILKMELARRFDIQVQEQELIDAMGQVVARQFAQYGMEPLEPKVLAQVAEEQLKDKQKRESIYRQVSDNKLYQKIYEAVTLDTKKVPLEEFQKLAADFFAEAQKEQ